MERKEFEPRKLFVGGLPPSVVSPDGLRAHFSTYGLVVEARVMLTPDGTGRGFGFVEFDDEAGALRALDARENAAHNAFFGRRIDVRKAWKRQGNRYMQTQMSTSSNNVDSKKIFVGGLRDKVTKDDLSHYFEKFGTITDVVVMYNKTTRKARGFGFVTFDSQEATDEVLKNSFHFLKGIKVETKNAEPRDQNGYYHDSMFWGPWGHWCSSYSYGGMYSPYNLPFYNDPFSIPCLYPYGPGMMMNYGYPTNQSGLHYGRLNEYATRSQSDSPLKENQQIIDITPCTGSKSDNVKVDTNFL